MGQGREAVGVGAEDRDTELLHALFDELLARLSPLQYDHINFLGRYAFTRPPAPGLRRLRDPYRDDETGDGEGG
ncbi:hypothetical protein Msi02_79680 [Microbispora siamensis]|uniref:Tn3 transposase DDE domain-containing protein n=1 Tax=Microbispora siamensis TaxID=564413 RepID=A0ABQ4H0D7_9ACTN|nr:hypothetical protein Msi02_79680 [Microbispora siamensis]